MPFYGIYTDSQLFKDGQRTVVKSTMHFAADLEMSLTSVVS